jgi:hypothetical protein
LALGVVLWKLKNNEIWPYQEHGQNIEALVLENDSKTPSIQESSLVPVYKAD